MTENSTEPTRTAVVLLFSHDPQVRDRMRLAIGEHPAADLTIRFIDADNYDETVRLLDRTDVDLLVLDGEAKPAGGMSIARQLKDEYPDAPPAVLVIARAADRWLAAFSRVDATLMHPLDPMTTGETIVALLREHHAVSAAH